MLPGENYEDDVFVFFPKGWEKYFIRFFGCQVDDQLDLKMIFLPFDGLQSFTDKKKTQKKTLKCRKTARGTVDFRIPPPPFQKKHHLVDQNGSIHSNNKKKHTYDNFTNLSRWLTCWL